MRLTCAKPERIWLKTHTELDERWLQDRIGEDPSLLGLGDLVLKDRELIQPRAGRLDLLLQDVDTSHRYEVEIQLGKTDEAQDDVSPPIGGSSLRAWRPAWMGAGR